MAGHISDDNLERYAMGAVTDEAELPALEEHPLACGPCVERADNIEPYVQAIRTALGDDWARR